MAAADPPFRRRALLLLALAAVVVGLGFVLLRRDSDTDRRLARLRAQGLPTTLAELDRWYAAIPEDQNFAPPLLDAADSLRFADNTNLFLGTDRMPPRDQPYSPATREVAQAFVNANREALDKVHEALQRPRARFPASFAASPVRTPYLGTVKRAGQALLLEACLATENGEPARAVAAVCDGLHLGDGLRADPGMLPSMIAWPIQLSRLALAERLLSRGGLADGELRQLQEAFYSSATNLNCRACAIGQLCQAEEFLRMSPSNVVAAFGPTTIDSRETAVEYARLWLYAHGGMTHRDYAMAVEVWDDLLQVSDLPFPERRLRVREIMARKESRVLNGYFPLARSAVPVNWFDRQAMQVARLKTAAIACAVERYRLAHGDQPPATLQALVPDFLPAVPRDPIDGQPLRFRPLKRGYVIYSVGDDEHDDGGVEQLNRPKNSPGRGWDETFVVER